MTLASRNQEPDAAYEVNVRTILGQCCSEETPALVVPIDQERFTCSALFRSVSDDGVVLAVVRAPEQISFHPLALCLVTFNQGSQTRVFFSHVRDWRRAKDPKKPSKLLLEVPWDMMSTESRSIFRVPILGNHGLSVRVTTEDGQTVWVKPLNISLGGLLVEFPEGKDPGLRPEAPLAIELQLHGNSVRLLGIVRHRGGRQYGLLFRETFHQGSQVAPEPLRALLTHLEEHWRRNR